MSTVADWKTTIIHKSSWEGYVNDRTRAVFQPASVKDGAYYCYCAYVLRISRYSDFLSVMLTNTGIFFARFKIMQKK